MQLSEHFVRFALPQLAHNKTQRITFDASSVSGILLFRSLSRIICLHGARVLAAPPPAAEPYSSRYKGIAAAHTALQVTGRHRSPPAASLTHSSHRIQRVTRLKRDGFD